MEVLCVEAMDSDWEVSFVWGKSKVWPGLFVEVYESLRHMYVHVHSKRI